VNTLEGRFLQLAYSHIRPEKTMRFIKESYSPDATRPCGELREIPFFQLSLDRPGADAYQAMKRPRGGPGVLRCVRNRFREALRAEKQERGRRKSRLERCRGSKRFQRQFTAPAKNECGFASCRNGRPFADIAQNLTHGDVTITPAVGNAPKDEDEVQHWLVEQMNARARGRFHAMREAEVAIGDKPDVIIASTSGALRSCN